MAITGRNTQFVVATHDISPYTTEVDFARSNDNHDTTTFGQTGHTFVTGLTNGKITVKGLWDKTAAVGSYTVFKALMGGGLSAAIIYGPEGSTTGNVKITCTATVVDYTESAPVADLVSFTANMQITGAVTDTTYP